MISHMMGALDTVLHAIRAPRWIRRPVCDWIDNYLENAE